MDSEGDREDGDIPRAPDAPKVKQICFVKVPTRGSNPISLPGTSTANKSDEIPPPAVGTALKGIATNVISIKGANMVNYIKDGSLYMRCPTTNKLLKLQVAKTISLPNDSKITPIIRGIPQNVVTTPKGSILPVGQQVFKPIAPKPITTAPTVVAKPQPENSPKAKVEVRSIQITNSLTGTVMDFKGGSAGMGNILSPTDATKVYNVQISNGRLSDPNGPIKMLGLSKGSSLSVTRTGINFNAPKSAPVEPTEKTPRKVTRSSSVDESPPRKTPRRLSEPSRSAGEMTPKVEEKSPAVSLFCDESMELSSEGEKTCPSPVVDNRDPLAMSDNEPADNERDFKDRSTFIPQNFQEMRLSTRREGEDEDPLNLIRWEDGVGYLYMSKLHFQFNELGIVDIMDEDEYVRYQQAESPYDHPLYEREINSIRMKQMQESGEPVYTCLGCTCFGLAADFLAPDYCSKACIEMTRKRKSINTEERQVPTKRNKRKDGRGVFPWKDYLEMTMSQRAPDDLFTHCRAEVLEYNEKHPFQAQTKFEAVDPDNCAVFGVVTVLATQGHRMMVHFDGCPIKYDFWVNFSCPDIFPPRWADHEDKNLIVPRGCKREMYFWKKYLNDNKAEGAKAKCFRHIALREFMRPHDFKAGMKLEAENVKGTGQLTVATVADVIGNRVRIHFDGNSDNFDYWCDYDSPRLHPIDYHKTVNELLITSTKRTTGFSWLRFLAQTRSDAVPNEAFVQRSPRAFRKGMKLEAVDRVCPEFIRPATVIDMSGYEICILYDGFDKDYAYWVDDDSTDIFPTGYCEITGHPIEAVPSSRWPIQKCGLRICAGKGNIHSQMEKNHDTAAECPYTPKNYNHRAVKPSRLTQKHIVTDYAMRFSIKKKRKFGIQHEEEKPQSNVPVLHKKPRKTAHVSEAIRKAREAKIATDISQPSTSQAQPPITPPTASTPPGAPLVWRQTSKIKHYIMGDRKQVNPILMTTDELANFLSNLPSCAQNAEKFRTNDINGEAFLSLTRDDLTQGLDIKLGPAIKLYNLIVKLRTDIKEQFLQF